MHLRAIQLDPNSVMARQYLTQHYILSGEPLMAIEASRARRRVDPIGRD